MSFLTQDKNLPSLGQCKLTKHISNKKIPNPLSDQDHREVLSCLKNSSQGFFPIMQIQLLDFITDRDSCLQGFDFINYLKQGYQTFAIVVNTITGKEVSECDPTAPCGIHWFCLFFDFRPVNKWDPKSIKLYQTAQHRITKACTMEYFNSSGNEPDFLILDYMTTVYKHIRKELPGLNLYIVTASKFRQQYSNTECGMFVLYFIMQRLQQHPYTFFIYNRIDDSLMLNLRARIFK